MNYTAPMTTLPEISAGLGTGATGQTWILNGIALGLAALLLVAGSLADDYGRKRVFVVGAGVLAVASVVCAVATGTFVFVAARVVQGTASAALLAAGLGLIGHAFPAGAERVRATGLWGAMIGLGIALGPVVTGLVAEAGSWRAGYWIFVGGAAAIVLAGLRLPESRAARTRRLDVGGVVTLGLGLAALLGAVTEGRAGWARPQVTLLFAAAALLIAAFVAVEWRIAQPMLDLALFRRPLFLTATGGALVTGLTVIGPMSYLPTVLQHTLKQSPLTSAGVFSIWSGASFVTALQARRLRMRGDHQLALGLALAAAGNVALLGLATHRPWPQTAAGLLVAGLGSGLVNAALARLAVESVPADRVSMGSGANNTARYIGSSLGVAIVVAITGAAGLVHGTDIAIATAAGGAALGAAAALLSGRTPAAR
ncbi:MFS transporter [Actinomadura alba]|uniref:MFS transporter n=2 Tax=Actinomadura alba TaxID=406431 RepID=A0ABR7LL48_9ACTN|nr:MFS transporter [Actinomadura alba]